MGNTAEYDLCIPDYILSRYVSIPDVMGNTAECPVQLRLSLWARCFNPRCDGEYSWMGDSLSSLLAYRGFQSPMWWGIQLNIITVLSSPYIVLGFNPRCDGEYSWIMPTSRCMVIIPPSFNPRCDGEYSWITCHVNFTATITRWFQSPMWWGIQLNNLPHTLQAEWYLTFQSPMWWGIQLNKASRRCFLYRSDSFNPRCDGEYSWMKKLFLPVSKSKSVSIPDVMGNTAESDSVVSWAEHQPGVSIPDVMGNTAEW